MQPLGKQQEQIANHHNGCVADQSIVIPDQHFFQPEVVLATLKLLPYIPAFVMGL